jgi:hypothetical protein
VCIGQPGSLNVGGTWHPAHFPLPLNTSLPRLAASALKKLAGGGGAFSAS